MLPIGTIVYLSGGNQKMMILNRGPIIEQKSERVYFDYTGSKYPEGLDVEEVFYFNDIDVDEVVFEGFKDSEEDRFDTLYQKWINENKGQLKKGETADYKS